MTLPISALSSPAFAKMKKQHVHDHGSAKLSIAVDGKTIGFDFDTPAQGLYGFEYEAKTATDKKTVAEANARFTATAHELFKFPADLGCKVSKAEIKKENEEGEDHDDKKTKGEAHETHSDMNAEVEFTCQKEVSGSKVVIALIKSFPRIKKIKVEILTGTKQGAETVTKPEQEVGL